jgi:hypothetical protein
MKVPKRARSWVRRSTAAEGVSDLVYRRERFAFTTHIEESWSEAEEG